MSFECGETEANNLGVLKSTDKYKCFGGVAVRVASNLVLNESDCFDYTKKGGRRSKTRRNKRSKRKTNRRRR
jgi:hypothetical protein